METSPESERRGIAWMLLSIVLFALNVLVVRAVALHTPSADGHVALVFRGTIGLMVVWVLFRGRGLEAGHLFRRPLVLARGAVGGIATLIFYLTITPLGAGRAVILNLTYPIFAAVMAALWIGEPIVRRQLGWMVVSFAGLVIFLGGKAVGGGVTGYEYLGLMGAVGAGGAVVLIRLLRHSEHPATVYASQCIWSVVVSLPLAMGSIGGLPVVAVAGLTAGAVMVAVAQLALTHAFRSLPVARGSAIQMLLPVLTACGGMAFFGERMDGWGWVGAVVILLGTYQAVSGGGGGKKG